MEGLDWTIPAINAAFWGRFWMIVLFNLFLSHENAVVIAMAVNRLPPEQKKWGIILGSSLVVVLRIIVTAVAIFLVKIPFLKLACGILILRIAIMLFANGHKDSIKASPSLMSVILMILIADFVMSVDHVFGVIGVSDGGMILIILVLVAGIPLVALKSWIVSLLMNRFPIFLAIGAVILGLIGGNMIISDKSVIALFHEGGPFANLNWGEVKTITKTIRGVEREIVIKEMNVFIALLFKILCAAGVIIAGKLLIRKGRKPEAAAAPLPITPE